MVIWLLQWQILHYWEILSVSQVLHGYCVAVQWTWSTQMCTWSSGRQLSDQPNVLPMCHARNRTAILLWKLRWLTGVIQGSAYTEGQTTHTLRGLIKDPTSKAKGIFQKSGYYNIQTTGWVGTPNSMPQTRTVIYISEKFKATKTKPSALPIK